MENTDYQFNDIEAFSATNAALAEYKERFAVVPDCTTKEGYEFVKQGLSELTKTRTTVDKARTDKTKGLREMVEKINSEGKRIIETLKEIEAPMREAKQKIDEEEKRKKEERIAKLQEKVDGIKSFIEEAKGKSSNEIQDIMEAVDLIDTENDFFDLKAEAIKVQQEVIQTLTEMMVQQQQFEVEAEARRKAEEENKKARLKAEIDEKINQFKMAPVDCIGKTSEEIHQKFLSLSQFVIYAEVFGDRTDEAQEARIQACKKLEVMRDQQKQLEAIEPKEEAPEPVKEVEEPSPVVEQEPTSNDPDEEAVFQQELKDADAQALQLLWNQVSNLQTPSLQSKEADQISGKISDSIYRFKDELNALISSF